MTREHIKQLDAAGELEWLKILVEGQKENCKRFSRSDISVVDVAVEIEEQQMVHFKFWREELARRVNNPALLDVGLVLVELSTPQAITMHEPDNSKPLRWTADDELPRCIDRVGPCGHIS